MANYASFSRPASRPPQTLFELPSLSPTLSGLLSFCPTPELPGPTQITCRQSPEGQPVANEAVNSATYVASYRVCDVCRRKKRKCSLERPICLYCRENKFQCVYGSKKRKPGPSKGQVRTKTAVLLSRVDRLELQLRRQQEATVTSVSERYDGAKMMQSQEWSLQTQMWSSTPGSHTTDRSSETQASETSNLNDTQGYQRRWSYLPGFCSAAPSMGPIENDVRLRLLSLYFIHIQPNFPLFREPVFREEYEGGKLPENLMAVVFALSAKFSSEPAIKALSNPNCWRSGEAGAEGVLEDGTEGDGTQPINLNDIKTAFLTSLYEYTHLPGRKAWTRMGILARMAYSCGLHQIDSPSNVAQMSDGEREERRYVWWAIWKLDTYSNCVASSPFLFDQENICTFLVSTSVEEFTAGRIMPSTRTLLAAGPGPLTRMFDHLKFTDASDGQKIYIIMNCLLREVSTVRRQLALNATPTVCDRLAALKNTCAYIRLALPTWYLHPVRKISPEEEPNTHRLRLEILLQLHSTCLMAVIPLLNPQSSSSDQSLLEQLALQDWQACIGHSEDIVAIFQYWHPSYFALVDPMISSIIWLTCCLLSLQIMYSSSENSNDAAGNVRLESALDLLTISLQLFSEHWSIAGLLLESVKELRGWNWFKISFSDLLVLLSRFQIPHDPNSNDPAKISMHSIISMKHPHRPSTGCE